MLINLEEFCALIHKERRDMEIFVNCSNHPSNRWTEIQKKAAEEYGEIVDVPFPIVECGLSSGQLEKLADKMVDKILAYNPKAVMCMGEFVVCYRITRKLKEKGIIVLASSSERKAVEQVDRDGTVRKESIFVFRGFREY